MCLMASVVISFWYSNNCAASFTFISDLTFIIYHLSLNTNILKISLLSFMSLSDTQPDFVSIVCLCEPWDIYAVTIINTITLILLVPLFDRHDHDKETMYTHVNIQMYQAYTV